MGSSSKSATVAFKYSLGLHVVLGYPVDAITKLFFSDKQAWAGSVSSGDIQVDSPNLCGGEDREGGVAGTVTVLDGGASQGQDSYLQSHLGSVIPAFRGVCSIVMKSFYVGTNPYIKALAVEVIRTSIQTDGSSQWDPTKANINDALNAAHIVREVLINAQWGMGYPVATIDEVSFLETSSTLYNEGFGLSMMWVQASSIEEFLREIVNHIDAKLSVSSTTGKWELKLIRKDYVVGDLLSLDPTNIVNLDKFSRIGLGETINEVSVVYRDHNDNKEKTVTAQNLGNIQMQGSVLSYKVNYPGIPNATLAAKVAQRDLLARSTPLTKVKLSANRAAASLSIGEPFRLNWPRLGIVDSVFRVGKINTGTVEDGTITIDAIEDVFGLPDSTYVAQQPTGWTDPGAAPVDIPTRALFEATYWDINMDVDADPSSYDPDFGFVQTIAMRPSGDSYKYDVFTAVGVADYAETGEGNFAPTALLGADLNYTELTLSYTDDSLMSEVNIGDHAYVGSEMVNVVSVNSVNKTFVVDRAILDTVPVTHTTGERIWFTGGHTGRDNTERVDAEEVKVKMLTTTSKGRLEEVAATFDTITLDNRYQRPYPPGFYRINGVSFPDIVKADLDFTWTHRDRTQQLAYFNTQDEGNIGPEVGTTYEFELVSSDLTVLDTATGITGTARTYAPTSDGDTLTLTLKSKVGTLESMQTITHTFYYFRVYDPDADFEADAVSGYAPVSDFDLGVQL